MIKKILICIIKFYKFLISPVLGNNCRYLPTCSEYFIDCLNEYGVLKGSYKGIKRILSCHPVKFLGGGHGLDPVKKKNIK
ncbi:membrane protein insertion efficiency factor YidD [Candidatus Pelagibacter sp.]|nr:membrane protein insertion efficiency factor YidD [Candidatus Pelagibacter sp.]